ncbi:hypothetical protein [Mesorhizobium ventifaucium]|uniref:Uncharacterized protein n=1 Tax=Mesorhizobium ventifaucium TaxID=666020 RepID=A0ABN8JN87_9HYPH|nr:hypothetical protein [Mesorhizobium ventifaucium]CAH2399133.1 conserved hypothetical protein [Mesorhizobium ventifaucium]
MGAPKQTPPRRWFVGRLESFEEVRRTVYEGDDFRNKTVAVFKTPEDARLAAAAPEMLAALDQIAGQELFNIAVNDVEVSPERMRALLGQIYELARIAAAKAEG